MSFFSLIILFQAWLGCQRHGSTLGTYVTPQKVCNCCDDHSYSCFNTVNFFFFFFFFFFFHWHSAHCGLWPVEQCPSICSYLPPTLSIFSLPALEELFLLPLSIFSWVFPFFLSLPVLKWRYFGASYRPPFSLGDLTSLSFALLSIFLYFLLCSSLLVHSSSDFPIPRFHI